MNWCNDSFVECYESILYHHQADNDIIQSIKNDLVHVMAPSDKSESSKNQLLTNSTVDFSNGEQFILNQQFVEHSIMLADELEINQIHMVEVLYYANCNTNGLEFTDAGRQYYFNRIEYICNILGYLIINDRLPDIVTDFDQFLDNVLKSFKRIYKIFDNLQDLVTKQNLINNTNETTKYGISFTNKRLVNCHELLGEILFNLVDHYPQTYRNLSTYNKIMSHLNETISDDDLFIMHYLPAIFSVLEVSSPEITNFHKKITESLAADSKLVTLQDDITDLTNSKIKHFEILVDFVFLVNLVNWCKTSKHNFNFNTDILAYLQICLNYGVLENLLRLTSATTHPQTIKDFEINNLCEFKLNLEHFPKLHFPKLNDSTIDITLSPVFSETLLPKFWHLLFKNFISNLAIVLIQLRDNEEDFLLSSINKQKYRNTSAASEEPQIDYDEIYSRADLERFYMSFVYTYNYRPELCKSIWNEDLVGFIMWGVNNNSAPLITATFCLLLGSLCSGNSSAILDILINNANIKKTDYSRISISSIVDSLNYYLTSLNENFKQPTNQRQSFFSNEVAQEELVELSNDSMVFITGFLILSSSIVSNLDKNQSHDIILNLFQRVKSIIVGFLKFDNTSNFVKKTTKNLIMNENNRISLHNLVLNLLKSFIQKDLKSEIWKIVDNWMFKDALQGNLGFKANLPDLSSMLNFVELIKELLLEEDYIEREVQRNTTKDLQEIGDNKGVRVYLDFLVHEVFKNSIKIVDVRSSVILQQNLVELFVKSLKAVDWDFLIQCPNLASDFDRNKFVGKDFTTYVKNHYSLIIMNYLYDERCLNTLFGIINLEKDELLVKRCLELVVTLVNIQETYVSLVDIINGSKDANEAKFNKTNVLEVINYNIPIIVKFGLLVESDNEDIVSFAVELLGKLNTHASDTLNPNKLLTIYLSSPESLNLRYAMVSQFNSGSIPLKFKILGFLLDDLQHNNLSTAHYILGFKVQGNYLVKDDNAFLKTLLDLLLISLDWKSDIVYYNSLKLSSMILNIIIKLCENPLSAQITWNIIDELDVNLFEQLILLNNVDSETIWEEEKFNGDLNQSKFIHSKMSVVSLFEFLNQRVLILKYLTLEFYNKSSTYVNNEYLGLLLNENRFLNGNYTVLSFLDVLNFKFTNFERSKFQKFQKFDLNELLKHMQSKELYDDEVFSKLSAIGIDVSEVSEYLHHYIYCDKLKTYQTNYLHNWVQLIEVIVNGNKMPKYQDFSLEILSNILPKIMEFFDTDVTFSEELILLCVLLFDNFKGESDKVMLLLSTCIKGVISGNSTIRLRKDLYVLLTEFLQRIYDTKNDTKDDTLRHIKQTFKNVDFKFFETIMNDIIINEGSIKVVGVILLEGLVHLFSIFNDNYLIENMVNNNSLLIIIRLIKRIDELTDDVVYELMLFKSIISLLIRIGTVRLGASYLIQSELFAIIKHCKILILDPDLNLKVSIQLYEILNPIFRLIKVLLISMDPSHKPSKLQGKDLLNHFNALKNNVIKKDILVNENKLKISDDELQGMNELIELFILLDELTKVPST